MKVSLYIGDLVSAPGQAVCSSTNPRLSLMMGTGAALRESGGWEILRACEAIVDELAIRRGQRGLPAGSAHTTNAGSLPFKAAIHCVACNEHHLSSVAIATVCVRSALAAAEAAGCSTVAMPVFGSGHARLPFEAALGAMAEALLNAKTEVERTIVVVFDMERAANAQTILSRILGDLFQQ